MSQARWLAASARAASLPADFREGAPRADPRLERLGPVPLQDALLPRPLRSDHEGDTLAGRVRVPLRAGRRTWSAGISGRRARRGSLAAGPVALIIARRES